MTQKQMTRQEAGKLGGYKTGRRSHKESLKRYYLNPTKCKGCGVILEVKDGGFVRDVRYRKFCSHSCSAKTTNHLRKKYYFCLYCGKVLNHQSKYCNHNCQWEHLASVFIDKWKRGLVTGTTKRNIKVSNYIRNYLLKKYDYSCQKCGWNTVNPTTKLCSLDIHHSDGNPKNNSENNLKLLCPNCHSLTPNYKYASGQSRKDKSIRSWRRIKKL